MIRMVLAPTSRVSTTITRVGIGLMAYSIYYYTSFWLLPKQHQQQQQDNLDDSCSSTVESSVDNNITLPPTLLLPTNETASKITLTLLSSIYTSFNIQQYVLSILAGKLLFSLLWRWTSSTNNTAQMQKSNEVGELLTFSFVIGGLFVVDSNQLYKWNVIISIISFKVIFLPLWRTFANSTTNREENKAVETTTTYLDQATKKKKKALQLSDKAMAMSGFVSDDDTMKTTTTSAISRSDQNGKKEEHQREHEHQQHVINEHSACNSCDDTNINNNRTTSLSWIIHDQEYDLSEFVSRHPGGKESILLGQGRDCTALFESYHPFTNQHRMVLQKYRRKEKRNNNNNKIVASDPSTTVNSSDDDVTNVDIDMNLASLINDTKSRDGDLFYKILKVRVYKKLKEVGIDPIKDRGATWTRSLYYMVIFCGWICTGYRYIKEGGYAVAFWFAIFGWLMGALGHDAGHFSTSRKYPWINEYGVHAMTLICNPIVWQHQHTYGHHSFTNEFHSDPDLHHFHTFLRVHGSFPYFDLYQYQTSFLYVVFAYLFVVFGECIWIPWLVFETGSLYNIVNFQDKHRFIKTFSLRLHIVLYVFVIIVLPLCNTSSSMLHGIGTSFVHIATLGLVFAFFSQINHLTDDSIHAGMDDRLKQKQLQVQHTEGSIDSTDSSSSLSSSSSKTSVPITSTSEFEDDVKAMISTSWAAAQVETSNDFASKSLFWHILSNGLNHQIEHHLFPGLNHCHLHHIAPVVKQTCEEYGVTYKSFDTWYSLLQATLSWYATLSVNENQSSKTNR